MEGQSLSFVDELIVAKSHGGDRVRQIQRETEASEESKPDPVLR